MSARQLHIIHDTALAADHDPCPHSGRRPPDAAHQVPMPAAPRRSMPADHAGPHSDGQSGRGGTILRTPDGLFARNADAGRGQTRMPAEELAALYRRYLAACCRMMGLDVGEVTARLARYAKNTLDRAWREAAYARQLAIYLAATEHKTSHYVPFALIGEVAGVTARGAMEAQRAVEDLRDDPDYEELIAAVLVDAALNEEPA